MWQKIFIFKCYQWCQTRGVISPILFWNFLDGLLNELSKSNVGCHIGGVLAAGFECDDDLKLLNFSVHALRIVDICDKYDAKYHIIFNGTKSQLIIYKCK